MYLFRKESVMSFRRFPSMLSVCARALPPPLPHSPSVSSSADVSEMHEIHIPLLEDIRLVASLSHCKPP